MITIFSRAIRSGKTTELLNFCKSANDVGGILMPDKGAEKQFYEIASQEYFSATEGPGETVVIISVGQFKFNRAAFERACDVLEASTARLVIVDEAGKLELRDDGFHKSILKLIKERSTSDGRDLLLVVRDSLLGEVLVKYGLKEAMIIQDVSRLEPG